MHFFLSVTHFLIDQLYTSTLGTYWDLCLDRIQEENRGLGGGSWGELAVSYKAMTFREDITLYLGKAELSLHSEVK